MAHHAVTRNALSTPEFFALQRVVAGRYSIVRELGRGGMGVVFLARDVALDRPVAIKLLPAELAAQRSLRERFLREARTAARLSHPHVVAIHAVEEHEDAVFFVMSFVDGETLRDRVAREGPLPGAEVMRIMQEVAWALAHAHAHGVVHRDVKPENILLERGSGRALVADFGIARREDIVDPSGERGIAGTPRYMSPEQSAGEVADARSDMYSLGAVAFFAATGAPPFDGPTVHAIMLKQAREAAPIARLEGRAPPSLIRTIERCLAKSPDARYSTTDDLAMELRRAMGETPDVASAVRRYVGEVESSGAEIVTSVTAGIAALVMAYFETTTMAISGSLIGDLFAGIGVMLYQGIAVAMGGLATMRFGQQVNRTRALLRVGYGHSAVKPAILLEQRRHDAEVAQRPNKWGMLLGGTLATAVAVFLSTFDAALLSILGTAGAVAIPALVVRSLVQHPGQGPGLWGRLMRGRLGRVVFRLAGVGLKQAVAPLPAAGEPTAIALGATIHELFESLPADRRAGFRELPDLVARLQADAIALRQSSARGHDDPRFAAAMAALETLRLDLLALHASPAAPDNLTRDIEDARRLGDEIAALTRASDGRLPTPT